MTTPDPIPSCPFAVLAANDRLREANDRAPLTGRSSGCALWSVDALRAGDAQLARLRAHGPGTTTVWPRITPMPRCTLPEWPTQAEYSERFAANFPEVASILPIEHVVVAGGAASWAVTGYDTELCGVPPHTPVDRGHGESAPIELVGDVDLFMVGLPYCEDSPSTIVAFWCKVHEVCSRLRRALSDGGWSCATEVCTPGLITFIAHREEPELTYGGCYQGQSSTKLQVQLILRAFPSVSALLHGFDVPACCVAYDGRTAVLTGLAAWAHVHRVNLVNPAYRSSTFERRLCKYFDRGFALGLLHLRRGLLDAAIVQRCRSLRLPRLNIAQLFHDCEGGATLAYPFEAMVYPVDRGPVGALESRYESASSLCTKLLKEHIGGSNNAAARCVARFNLHLLGRGKTPCVMASVFNLGGAEHSWEGATDYRTFAVWPPTTADVLNRATFCDALDRDIRRICNGEGVAAFECALGLGLTIAECDAMRGTDAVLADYSDADRAAELAAATMADAVIDRLHAAYDAMPEAIDWCIELGVGSALTACFAPLPESPADWYGDAYAGDDCADVWALF